MKKLAFLLLIFLVIVINNAFEIKHIENQVADLNSKLTATNNRVLDVNSTLHSQISKLDDRVTSVEIKADLNNKSIKELKAQISELKQELDNSTYINTNPTYQEVIDFIQADDTNLNPYIPEKYECSNYAFDVVRNAWKHSLFASPVIIRFKNAGHVIVAFNTSDRGIVFIEPETDMVVKLKQGERYCQINGLSCAFDDKVIYYEMYWR